ncbi:hypothetical protein [Streptomyces sp. NPDC058475]|uniref:hypothetical protein n=1 Tax=Streptomyces sp. NPDC058475 TaxID=3346518 RepID=UPI0036682024
MGGEFGGVRAEPLHVVHGEYDPALRRVRLDLPRSVQHLLERGADLHPGADLHTGAPVPRDAVLGERVRLRAGFLPEHGAVSPADAESCQVGGARWAWLIGGQIITRWLGRSAVLVRQPAREPWYMDKRFVERLRDTVAGVSMSRPRCDEYRVTVNNRIGHPLVLTSKAAVSGGAVEAPDDGHVLHDGESDLFQITAIHFPWESAAVSIGYRLADGSVSFTMIVGPPQADGTGAVVEGPGCTELACTVQEDGSGGTVITLHRAPATGTHALRPRRREP